MTQLYVIGRGQKIFLASSTELSSRVSGTVYLEDCDGRKVFASPYDRADYWLRAVRPPNENSFLSRNPRYDITGTGDSKQRQTNPGGSEAKKYFCKKSKIITIIPFHCHHR